MLASTTRVYLDALAILRITSFLKRLSQKNSHTTEALFHNRRKRRVEFLNDFVLNQLAA